MSNCESWNTQMAQLTCIHDPGGLVDACSMVVGAPQVVGHDGCGAALAHAHFEPRAAEKNPVPAVPLRRPKLESRVRPLRVNGTLLDRKTPEERSLGGGEWCK